MQLQFPQLALVSTPEGIFIKRLQAEAKESGISEVGRMIIGQDWLKART